MMVCERLRDVSLLHRAEGCAIGMALLFVLPAAVQFQGVLELSAGLRNNSRVGVLPKLPDQIGGKLPQCASAFREEIQDFGEDHFGRHQEAVVESVAE